MKYLALAFISIVLLSCGATSSSVESGITGKIESANSMNVYLDKVNPLTNTNDMVGRAETNGSGEFTIPFSEGLEDGIYRVRIGRKSAYIILDDFASRVSITGDLNKLQEFDYTVEGSAQSTSFVSTMNQFRNKSLNLDGFINKVKSESSPVAAFAMAIMALNDPNYADVHKTVLQKMTNSGASETMTQEYGAYIGQLEQLLAQRRVNDLIKVGKQAPNITMPGPDGKERSLTDLKGKVVLLDFWASWCGPCRKANPKVVETYKKYKSKGFTVASVSLDGLDTRTRSRYPAEQIPNQLERQKDRWTKAIEQDQLLWDWHVSDLKKWDSSAAATYGVRSIPKTFLIDRDGKIASIDPRYTLEQEVLKYL